MTGKELFQEIGNINEEYIVEAECYQKETRGYIASRSQKENAAIQKQEECVAFQWGKNNPSMLRKLSKIVSLSGKSGLRRTFATAACLLVCLGLVFTVQKVGMNEKKAFDAENASMRQMEGLKPEAAAPDAAEGVVTSGVAAGAAALGAAEALGVPKQTVESGVTESIVASSEACLTVESTKEELKEDISGIQEEMSMTDNKDGAGQNQMAVSDKENMDGSVLAVKELQANYSNSYEELLQEKDAVVVAREDIQNGKELWERFRLSAIAGEQAHIDVITFTKEGDAIIKTITFKDGIFRLCVDRTRDRELGTGEAYYEDTFTWLETIETKTEEKTTIEYVLRKKSSESTGLTAEADNYLIFYIEK